MWQELRGQGSSQQGLMALCQNKNQKPHAHLHMITRQSIKFQISPMKDLRGVAGTRSDRKTDGMMDGQNDGRTDKRMLNLHIIAKHSA